jgi:hypothetical protein
MKVATPQGLSHLVIRLRHAAFVRGTRPPSRGRVARARAAALRHAPCRGRRGSPRQADRASRHVVEGERQRDAGVAAHQGDHGRDADVAEGVDRAVLGPLRPPALLGEARRHLLADLLAWVGQRGRQAREELFDRGGRQPGRLGGPGVRVGRRGRMKRADEDADRALALALAERIAGAEMRPERPHHRRQLGVVHIDLVRAGSPTARLKQRAIACLLLVRHLLLENLGIASKRGGLGHGRSPGRQRAVGPRRPAVRQRATAGRPR